MQITMPPAGWYPDPRVSEQMRYCNGAERPDQTRPGEATQTISTEPAAPVTDVDAQRSTAVDNASKKPLYKRTWAVAVGAGVLGLIIGSGASAADPTDS